MREIQHRHAQKGECEDLNVGCKGMPRRQPGDCEDQGRNHDRYGFEGGVER